MNDQDSRIWMLEKKSKYVIFVTFSVYGIITRPTICGHGLSMFRLRLQKEGKENSSR